ncbi:unnamed protein product [Callosobruchus maculatus]|uniref:Uncharacterized protein n=1 Tax=Callosobruchus maculatus TaxID=64391 RepID=A0A653C9T3_CALMS|nr:unnamed protein product [Callosobruchus maculatus]
MCQMQNSRWCFEIKNAFPSLETQVKKGKLLEPSVLEKLSYQRSIHMHTAGLSMN